jgi:NAD(P)-dependent dehydrogenase (short-subunit alcohol dehydrogenase family)
MNQVVLITGASSGIGAACAAYLGRRGFRVYGTSRHAPLEVTTTGPFQMIRMDVNEEASVARGIGLLLEREGRLDVVVNNAGIVTAGPIEDATLDEAQSQFETNFFGVLRVCKAVLPIMREQRSGYIINISSLAGRAAAPYQGLYSATKFAVEGLSEALHGEVRHFGIKVVLIEPGDAPTRNTESRIKILRTPAYAPYYENAIKAYEYDERHGCALDKFGPLLEQIIENPHPRLRYMCGLVFQTVGATLKNFVPYSLFEWVLAKLYKF